MTNNVDVLEIYVRNRLSKSLWLKNEIPTAPEDSIPHYQLHITRGIYLNLGMSSNKALKEILSKEIPREVGAYVAIGKIVNKVIKEARQKTNE